MSLLLTQFTKKLYEMRFSKFGAQRSDAAGIRYLAGLYLKIRHNTIQYFKLTDFWATLNYFLYFIKCSPYQKYFTQML
jgi:hypothetical protein